MDFLPVIVLYLEVFLLAFAEKKLWNTWFTPLNCLAVPYAVVLAICLCVDGNMGFMPFYYPSVWIWVVGLAVFFVPSCIWGLLQRRKNGGNIAPAAKEFTISSFALRIIEYITWGIFALFLFWFFYLTFVKNLIPGGENFAQEWAGHGFFGHLFTLLMGLNIFWLSAADKNHKRYWLYVLGFFGVALLYLVKGWFIAPMAAGLLLRLLTGKTRFGIKIILISAFTGLAFFFATYWMTLYVAASEKGIPQERVQQTTYKTEVSSYIGKHAVTYMAAGVYGLSEDLAQNTLEDWNAAKIYAPFVNIGKLFGKKDYVSNINDQFVQITTNDAGSNIRSFFGTLYVFLGFWHSVAYVLVFSCLLYFLFAFASQSGKLFFMTILSWFEASMLMGWFDITANTLTFFTLPAFLAVVFGLCFLYEHRKDIAWKKRIPLRRIRRSLALFQTISFSAMLLLFGLPFHVSNVFLGISASLAFLFLWTIPRRVLDFRFLKQCLPFLLIYLLLWGSILYADYPGRAAVFSFKQTALILVPFIFWGMTPRFFSSKRIRLFAGCFLAGCVLLIILKIAQLVYCFHIFWPYFKVHYVDAGVTYMGTGSGFLYALNEFLSNQSIYLSWAGLKPVMHTTTEALILNMAFSLLFIARIQKHPLLSSRFKKCMADAVLLLFALILISSNSKIGQFLFAVNIFSFILLAFKRKNKKLAYSIIGILLVAGIIGFHYFGMGISNRFSKSIQTFQNLNNENSPNDRSLLPRIYCWQTGIRMVKEKPVLGFGSSFKTNFKEHFAADHPDYPRDYKHPHNQFLLAMLTNGVFGLLAFLLFWIQAVRLVWKNRQLWGWNWLFGLLLLCSLDTIFYQWATLYCCLPYCFLMVEYYNRKKISAPAESLPEKP